MLKKILKIPFCRLVYGSRLLHFYLKTIYSRRKEFPAVIIYYHRFIREAGEELEKRPSVTHRISDFTAQMRFVQRYFQVVSLDKAVATLMQGKTFARPTVVLTVDDGYKDNYDVFFPVLKEKRLPATIFLTTDLIGTDRRIWVEALAEVIQKTGEKELKIPGLFENQRFPLRTPAQRRKAYIRISEAFKELPSRDREAYVKYIEQKLAGDHQEKQPVMLNWDQVREMRRAGITFGAHTGSHPILSRLPLEDAKDEIGRSKRKIEKELGERVRHFAVPNGKQEDFSRPLEQYCRELGFESVSTTLFGRADKPADCWRLKRIAHCLPLELFAVNLVRALRQEE